MFRENMFARIIPAAIFAVLLLAASASAQTKLLRFPDIHGDRVAFTYGGDIWTAPAIGGTATRLTETGSHSPDSTTATNRFT